MAQFPSQELETISDELPYEEEVAIAEKDENWTMTFDGSSTATGGGAGVVLTSPTGQTNFLLLQASWIA